ncbi:DUF960 domain-containing protein [Listeria weihenstephanensis]|uniref:DUF960 domain-containing protein n=1 Tax=Listeria weihenstephanensis TaxID=1006155 RepID=A0A841Z401_9LIST|nr:DUF960 family protein [Listeria weihenstephanensis]MBC1499036.1 DUF960 domain-containing protein [Listeria weihenstephanensis]
MPPKYRTRAVDAEIPFEIQDVLWQLFTILKQSQKPIDYLHVFELSVEPETQRQTIHHRQEVPKYKKTVHVTLTTTKPMHRTIWIIEEADYCMMLFPSDY